MQTTQRIKTKTLCFPRGLSKFMDSVVLLSILGSVASLSSLLISAPTLRSKIIHAIYGFLLVVVVGSSFIYNQDKISELAISEQKSQSLQEKIDRMDSVSLGAKAILEGKSYSSPSDVGKNRGFILTSFAFMEKNKASFPESYEIAKKLIIDGIKITESADYFGEETYNEQKKMEDGASAMRELLHGISAGKT
jgi:hypothetical protein